MCNDNHYANAVLKPDEFRGWIAPCVVDFDVNACRRELESLGVDVGAWDMFAREFQGCIVTPEAFDKLDPLWGRYIWGLEP